MGTHTRKRKYKEKPKHRKTRYNGGKTQTQFDNFQMVGKSLDSFLSLFNIDELSKKNAAEYLGYKTFKRNNIFTFTLLPSTIKENQYSGLKVTKKVKNDPGVTFMDNVSYNIDKVNESLGELVLGYYNISNKNERKGIYQKDVVVKETLRDNLPPVEEANIERFMHNRFDHL
jgi:hypothetical protein